RTTHLLDVILLTSSHHDAAFVFTIIIHRHQKSTLFPYTTLFRSETPIGEEDDSHLGDFIEDEVIENPVDYTTRVVLREQLDEVLDTLTDREENVLRLRFGLDDGKMRTLEDVGEVFNVTRERIRQIEAKALR